MCVCVCVWQARKQLGLDLQPKVDRKARQKRWEAKQNQNRNQKPGKGGRRSTKAAGKPKLSPSKGIQASRYT